MSLTACFSGVLRNGLMNKSLLPQCRNLVVKQKKLWVPDYVILAENEIPKYDAINVQIKGYDFVILERYQKFIAKLAKVMAINVSTSWAAPQQDLKIVKYKPNSTTTENEYALKLYERNVQVVDVKSNIMSLFLEAVITSCPPGVKISVHEHCEEFEIDRYIPNLEIQELKEQVEQIGSKKKTKKTKTKL